MPKEPSHRDCLEILAEPSTQNILEKLGFEYSTQGAVEYRKSQLNIVPMLVRAIVEELQHSPVFPPKFSDRLPECGVYIRHRGAEFILADVEKPSIQTEYAFSSPVAAARGYVRKILDTYWLQADSGIEISPTSVRTNGQ